MTNIENNSYSDIGNYTATVELRSWRGNYVLAEEDKTYDWSIQAIPMPDATLEGTQGKNGWYKENVSLKPETGYKISTDLTDAEIAYYLLNASTYLNYERQQIQIPVEGTYTCETIRGASVLCPDFSSNIRELQQKIYGYTKIGDDETDSGYQTGNNNGYSDSAADNGYNNSYDNGTSTYNNNYNDAGANTFY